MALCVCEYCGKAFNSLGSSNCPACMELLDGVYAKVRKYIYQSDRRATFAVIVEQTGVPEKALSLLISQGRIVLDDRTGSGVKCKVCGKEAQDGVLCRRCRETLISEKLLFRPPEQTGQQADRSGKGVLPLHKK